MRSAEIKRETRETSISVYLNLDEKSAPEIATGIGFFDHMLTAFAVHSGFTVKISCVGDLNVDGHHTVEDIGIALGQAFCGAVGGRAGIARYASQYIPMDEALALAVVDISGRPFLALDAAFPEERVGEFDTCLVVEFFRAFAVNAGITLHLRAEYGHNSHHMIEALFKAAAHALRQASRIAYTDTLSSKGVL